MTVVARNRRTTRGSVCIRRSASGEQVTQAKRVLAVIELANEVPHRLRIMEQCGDSLDVCVGSLEGRGDIHVIWRGIAVTVVIEAGQPQALEPPISAEGISRQARHYL